MEYKIIEDEILLSGFNLEQYKKIPWKGNIRKLHLDKFYDSTIENIIIPNHINKIILCQNFKIPLNKINITPHIKKISYCNKFNKEDINCLPDSIQSIKFYGDFNFKIKDLKFPKFLKKLDFGIFFNQSLDNIIFPETLEKINLGHGFNKSLDNVVFPESLKKIEFNSGFSQSIENINWPKNIEELIFGWQVNIVPEKLPKNLIKLTIKLTIKNFNEIHLENLPPTIKELTIYNLEKPIKNLPPSLEKLILYKAEDSIIEKIKLPYGCKKEIYEYNNFTYMYEIKSIKDYLHDQYYNYH